MMISQLKCNHCKDDMKKETYWGHAAFCDCLCHWVEQNNHKFDEY